jgi:valyl-tRNA synthetase
MRAFHRRVFFVDIIPLPKTYDPAAIEGAMYARWEAAGWFAPSGEGPAYCIMIPPPNVTGSLHMGHAFQDTIMDALIRYHRMHGHNTLWQAGTDHAGIATQMVVERQLEAEGKTRHDLGREHFIERVWNWKGESGGTISRQLRRMGASLDWSRERFTMDEGLSRAVLEVFVRLYEEGLIYRGKRLVNWDPVLHTAISDLEVISEEEDGQLWNLRYPIVGRPGEFVVVATTRPETMLGDAAVAVHPDDGRYQSLVGQTVELPLTRRRIPVIADVYVDPAFGSGCVKITPAHDFNDYEVGQRHQLPLINVFDPSARIQLPGSPYHGLDRYEARKRIVSDLENAGLLDGIKPHKLMVPRGDRSRAVVEPYLTDQWYVDLTREVLPDGRAGGRKRIALPAIRAIEDGSIRFVPENWSNTYFQWMHNIKDWCISRQLWWGHRIPAWYDADGSVYVGRNEAEVRAKHALGTQTLRQDEDVLDTWFSSALWPFSTLGWPDNTAAFKTFYPTNVLVTGFDIIFFWVARMIMMGLHFTGSAPFREVYVHGLVRDAEGQKMSKSRGNVLDPIDIIDGIGLEALVEKRTREVIQPHLKSRIEKLTRTHFPAGIPAFGTDALRFTFAAVATQGRDVRFDLGRLEGYRNFCNKLWNAARFVLMNTEEQDTGLSGAPAELGLAERWILARLQQVIVEVDDAIAGYRFDQMAQALHAFAWDEYCAWYLELAKVTLNNDAASPDQKRGTRRTLVQVLEALLRLLHPLMPFLTEEIWGRVASLAGVAGDTIMLQPYPRPDPKQGDDAALAEMRWVQAVIAGTRNIRGENNIEPSKRLPVLFAGGNTHDHEYAERNRDYLIRFGRYSDMRWLAHGESAPQSATALVGALKVLVPLGALIDRDAELSRLKRELEKTDKDFERVNTKLASPSFVDKAPAAVVDKERRRLDELQTARGKLIEQIARIEAM